jgi:hypothetical protein
MSSECGACALMPSKVAGACWESLKLSNFTIPGQMVINRDIHDQPRGF